MGTVLSHSSPLAATKETTTHMIRSKVFARSSTVTSVFVVRMVILGGLEVETSLLRSPLGIRMVINLPTCPLGKLMLGMVISGSVLTLEAGLAAVKRREMNRQRLKFAIS
jgi:hypothetical protein